MKRRVLFLCTGNSARSQMAEAVVNGRWNERWHAYSAGTEPEGYVHPLAVRAMGEIGILMDGARSKGLEELAGMNFDLLVTVCDGAAQNCPVWPGGGERVHLGFPDPAAATGSEEDKMAVFRSVRDDILVRVESLLSERD